jgi:ABC-type phosphonate transport system ATPase subunit
MTNNPKITNEERRRQLYFKKWGLNEKNSTGDLRQDIRNWGEEGEREKAQEKKNKLSKAAPTKPIDVDSITKSRIFLEKIRGDFNHD